MTSLPRVITSWNVIGERGRRVADGYDQQQLKHMIGQEHDDVNERLQVHQVCLALKPEF